MINAKPTGAGQENPHKNHEAEHFGKVEKFREPAERRRRSDIFDRGSRNRHNHHASKHHAGSGRECAEDEEEAENELHCRNKDSVELRKGNVRRNQSLAHLFPALRHEEFGAAGKKEHQTNR